jgi:transposase
MARAGTLPNDIETLKQLVLERTAALEVAQALLLSRQHEIEQLKLQIARLRRLHFGRSSEHEQIRQLEFKLEELESEQGSLPVPPPSAAERRRAPQERTPAFARALAARVRSASARCHVYLSAVRRGARCAR